MQRKNWLITMQHLPENISLHMKELCFLFPILAKVDLTCRYCDTPIIYMWLTLTYTLNDCVQVMRNYVLWVGMPIG